MTGICSIPGCGKCVDARGWCHTHYMRWRRRGRPLSRARIGNGEARQYFHNTVLKYDGDDCLIWPYARTNNGYALMREGVVPRLVCETIYGPPPALDYQAAHSCGNGHLGCVAKQHLRWATQIENMADQLVHGTRRAKLTTNDVQIIRDMAANGVPQADIARAFAVGRSAIWAICAGRSWAWFNDTVRK